MATPRVPGIGFIGLGQMDPASQLVFSKAFGTVRRNGGTRKRRPSSRKRGTRKRRTRASAGASSRRRNGKFVKGSAAAKRHMAKLRRMRKR